MKQVPGNPWIHIGECPVCVNGLCRVRACQGQIGGQTASQTAGEPELPPPHLYALCDECEALWTEPDTSSTKTFANSQDPRCPICGAPLYGEQSRWALPQDVEGTNWEAEVIFELASPEAGPDDNLSADDV